MILAGIFEIGNVSFGAFRAALLLWWGCLLRHPHEALVHGVMLLDPFDRLDVTVGDGLL